MHEMLFWAAGARRPIVMPVVSRALGPPWNIWTDHMDVMGERDTGWMQLFCENNQETLDLILMAYRVAEDKDIMLPAMIIEDGFILSHTFEKVDVPAIEEVDFYLHPFNPLVVFAVPWLAEQLSHPLDRYLLCLSLIVHVIPAAQARWKPEEKT